MEENMPDLKCVGDICLESGHWILVIVGTIALAVMILTILQRAFTSLAAALTAFLAFLTSLVQGCGLLLVAAFVLFLLYCGVTGTWKHINLPW
jgi:hypothetical protein